MSVNPFLQTISFSRDLMVNDLIEKGKSGERGYGLTVTPEMQKEFSEKMVCFRSIVNLSCFFVAAFPKENYEIIVLRGTRIA